jgi:putative ABC transport system permease protein
VYSGASLAVLAWGLAANTVRPDILDDGSTATFIVIGTVLTFSAVRWRTTSPPTAAFSS